MFSIKRFFIATLIFIVALAATLIVQKDLTKEFVKPYPAQRYQMIQADGFNIHYRTMGQGEPILLLHGIGASVLIWKQLIPLLAKNYKVIAVDIPGFGLSDKQLDKEYGLDEQSRRINAFLDKLNIPKTHIVGSSMGGALALWLAAKFPERYRTVTALSAPSGNRYLFFRLLHRVDSLAKLSFWFINKNTLRWSMGNVFSDPSVASDERVARSLNNLALNNSGIRVVFKALKLISDPRVPNELTTIQQPLLLVHTDVDKVVPIKSSLRLKELIPHADYISHPTAGHHIMEDKPEWTARTILGFLAKHRL